MARTLGCLFVALGFAHDGCFALQWHLGDFFPKREYGEHMSFANAKWPVSNPSIHGFDEWVSTEASGPTSTPNCGCNHDWKTSGQGCISGGGIWRTNLSWVCMNYWQLANDSDKDSNECRSAQAATRSCVTNATTKITGDDAVYIIDSFEAFLNRSTVRPHQVSSSPFLAVLWLHTIHMPRGALPQYFHAYKDAFGDPAGDYLGALSQMDVQLGRLRQLLQVKQLADDTMLWFSSDNGPCARSQYTSGQGARGRGILVSAARDRSPQPQYAATLGLRQCKASLYEGGIRVPGILEWPAVIKRNARTYHPAYHADYLPTFLDVTGTLHPQADWATDGMSLLPLITKLANTGAVNDTTLRPSAHPLKFDLEGQSSLINNQWKVLESPKAGDCDLEPGSHGSGRLLFNLDTDPTESMDLSKNATYADIFSSMSSALDAFKQSIVYSAVYESQCRSPDTLQASEHTIVDAVRPGCKSPLMSAHHHHSPTPPTPAPSGPFFKLQAAGACMGVAQNRQRAAVTMEPCHAAATSVQQWWQLSAGNVLVLNGTQLCAKPKNGACAVNVSTWLGIGASIYHHIFPISVQARPKN